MRNYLSGLFSGALIFWAGGQIGIRTQDPAPDLVRARSIEIVDELGTARLVLGVNEHGGAVSVKDTLGRTVMLLGAGAHGGTMILREQSSLQPVVLIGVEDRGGRLRVQHAAAGAASMSVDEDGARLTLGTPDGEPRAELHTATGDAASLALRNRQGDLAVLLAADDADRGTVTTYGRPDEPVVRLGSTASGHGLIYTYDPAGNPLIRLTATDEHVGQIYTMNSAGEIQIALASHAFGPTLRLFSSTGQPAVTIQPNERGEGEVSAWAPNGAGNTLRPPAGNDD